jgi:hypothetical protein
MRGAVGEGEDADGERRGVVSQALLRCAGTGHMPLSLAFLCLRCARYDPSALVRSWLPQIEAKLTHLVKSTGAHAVRAYRDDLGVLLSRDGVAPEVREWLQRVFAKCNDGVECIHGVESIDAVAPEVRECLQRVFV